MSRRSSLPSPEELTTAWLTEAGILHRYGAEAQARVLESCAAALEDWYRTQLVTPLTLKEAARESGYSESTLQQKIAAGRLPNAGKRGAPRILRRDLPRKAGADRRGPSSEALDVVRLVLDD